MSNQFTWPGRSTKTLKTTIPQQVVLHRSAVCSTWATVATNNNFWQAAIFSSISVPIPIDLLSIRLFICSTNLSRISFTCRWRWGGRTGIKSAHPTFGYSRKGQRENLMLHTPANHPINNLNCSLAIIYTLHFFSIRNGRVYVCVCVSVCG